MGELVSTRYNKLQKQCVMEIPTLRKKLNFLYQRDRKINTDKALANALAITPQAITGYVAGNESRKPDMIPDKHIKKFCDQFGLQVGWLTLPYSDFVSRLKEIPVEGNKWESIIQEASTFDAINIVRADSVENGECLPGYSSTKGMVPEGNYESRDKYTIGERIYIELKIDPGKIDFNLSKSVHIISLVIDKDSVSCILNKECGLDDASSLHTRTIRIPSEAPNECLRVTGPAGEQYIAVFLFPRSPSRELNCFQVGNSTHVNLNNFAGSLLKANKSAWEFFNKSYDVV